MANHTKIRRIRSDLIFDITVNAILALLLLIVAYPLWFVIIASVSDPTAVSFGKVIVWPVGFSLEGYKEVVNYPSIWRSYLNTIIYTLCDVGLTTVVTVMAGYALSRRDFVGKKLFVIYMTITMFFSGGLIPTYLTVRSLGLMDKWPIVFLLGCVSVRNIVIVRTFIQSNIPESLVEAAFLDGCSHTKFLLWVVVPLSLPVISVIALFSAVGQWNSWFNAMIYLRDENMMPLQIVLRNLLVNQTAMMRDVLETGGNNDLAQAQKALSMKYALIIVATLPIMCVYPFLQRFFVKGMTMGSIKG
ncbi:MAG: carbohydrate ABC transporter permease [Clostridia bacterium]|nr:carbohydrate ABC transporter permease [Clostridia bacterium]